MLGGFRATQTGCCGKNLRVGPDTDRSTPERALGGKWDTRFARCLATTGEGEEELSGWVVPQTRETGWLFKAEGSSYTLLKHALSWEKTSAYLITWDRNTSYVTLATGRRATSQLIPTSRLQQRLGYINYKAKGA